ncbi:hypothetical protein DFQ27_004140 [Actinomortierella ambigua]|uniref:non-specific serine/threonine protein kinase n=1 Tax=Actinomortierella ambigua TaxID=1343610 RepID=A0A9P6UCC8_9FUNG|nr:hypothetical protein DFQ27_004140 [Actinomortierella ambigua]
MLAEKKYRPQPLDMVLPPHSPGKAPPSRDATAHPYHQKQYSPTAVPPYHTQQPQMPVAHHSHQNTPTHHHRHHHHHYQPQHNPTAQAHPYQHQQQLQPQHHTQQHSRTAAPTANQSSRRSSVDRGSSKEPSVRLKTTSTPKPSHDHVGPYLLGKTLGKGSSGCVKLARHRKSNEQVAIKIISKASLVNRAAVHRGIEREIAIMKLINHPHVIRLYDVYETEKELFLVMEYVSGGELFEYLVNKGRLEEAEALRFFQQIIVGLAFCHKRKICHRDLKPENLLLDDRMNVKIADFGMASLQKTGRLLETSCGSPHYASPEVVTGMKYDGSSSDIWSCGIILYALLTGHLPFDDENIRQLLSKVKAGKFYMPTDISAGARDLISRMLTVNPKRRITMQGVMMHPWFRMVNPERNTLGEPAQDPDSWRPMQVEELDAEILRHMRWLFAPGPSHSDPDSKATYDEEALLQEIQEKMTNNEENMEKLFYHLLHQHKNEVLENYAGDDCESVLDGPRRRADSFPNSAACSIRSATPDFFKGGGSHTTTRSARDSPATTPSSPLTMAATPASAAAAASAVVGGSRYVQAEPTPLHLNELEPESPSTRKSSPDSIVRVPTDDKKGRGVDGLLEKTGAEERATTPISNKDPAAVLPVIDHRSQASTQEVTMSAVAMLDERPEMGKKTKVTDTKFTTEDGTLVQEGTVNINTPSPQIQFPQSPAIHSSPPVVAPTPISPTRKTPLIGDAVLAVEDGEAGAAPVIDSSKHEPLSLTSVGATSSIESQVLATQISEATADSLMTMATAMTSITTGTTKEESSPSPSSASPYSKTVSETTATTTSMATNTKDSSPVVKGVTSAIKTSPSTHASSLGSVAASVNTMASDVTPEKAKTTQTRVKPQRPILHPLDVKASAGMTVMTVSAAQHTRKYSDGSPTLPGTPLSPTGPKRPWFARLFDFKPQPLMFRSTLTALETQDRLESILREMFGSQIQIENFKRPSNGFKCKYEGGVIDGQQAKAVKFKVEIQEKTRPALQSNAGCTTVGGGGSSSSCGSGSSVSSHHNSGSSSAVATMLAATADMQGRCVQQQQSQCHQQRHLRPDVSTTLTSFRRASDGGSILLAAAAAAAATMNSVRNTYHQHYHSNHHQCQQQQQQKQQQQQPKQPHHRHSVDGSTVLSLSPSINTVASSSSQTLLSKRAVKVTLHQQQGANSTLRMIYERLCFVWDQQALMYHKHRPPLAPPPPPPSSGGGGGGSGSGSTMTKAGHPKRASTHSSSSTTESAMTTMSTAAGTTDAAIVATHLVVTTKLMVALRDRDRDFSLGGHRQDDGLSGSKLYLVDNSPIPTIEAKAPRGAAI